MGAQAEGSSAAAQPSTPIARGKRKLDLSDDGDNADLHATGGRLAKVKKAEESSSPGEKRFRRFRSKAPAGFQTVFHRATTQRFYVLDRVRGGTPEHPEETVELAGSTGNVYRVVIAQQPTCNCPHARAGHQCKHVLYVLSRVLRARFELVYQLALLPSELREIFAAAPPPPSGGAGGGKDDEQNHDKRRKPVEGDCPICFMELEAEGGEPVVWCRAACGQNIHKECFDAWARTKRQGGAHVDVTCPYCRSVWQNDEISLGSVSKTGKPTAEGYINVADQLGLSTARDTSTYSRWWSGHDDSYRRHW